MARLLEEAYRKIIGAGNAALSDLRTDYPESLGDRERGRLRPVDGWPRLTAVAVTDAQGNEIGTALVPHFGDFVREMRLLRLALQLQGLAADLGDLNDLNV